MEKQGVTISATSGRARGPPLGAGGGVGPTQTASWKLPSRFDCHAKICKGYLKQIYTRLYFGRGAKCLPRKNRLENVPARALVRLRTSHSDSTWSACVSDGTGFLSGTQRRTPKELIFWLTHRGLTKV